MSLIDMLDSATDPREIQNIGRAIANSRRDTLVKTRNRITIIGAEHGTQSKIEIRHESPLNS